MRKIRLFASLSASLIFVLTAAAEEKTAPPAPPASLDQKDKELQAQEEMLMKQVGQLPFQSETKSGPGAEASRPTAAPAAPAEAPVKVQKAERKAPAAAPAPVCNNSELQSAQVKIKKLQADLDDARNRLMISETEVERLSLLVDEQNRRTGRVMPPSQASLQRGLRVRDSGEIQAKADSDMPIATVITEKAQLRTGPGKDNSPLMTVGQGTRLAVETRTGDWYRVISPTGARAWVSSDVIDFGNATNPESAVRGKGYSLDAEDAAFQALQKGTKSQRTAP